MLSPNIHWLYTVHARSLHGGRLRFPTINFSTTTLSAVAELVVATHELNIADARIGDVLGDHSLSNWIAMPHGCLDWQRA